MTGAREPRDHLLLHEISQLADDYGAKHRHTVRELARGRAELAQAHTVLGTVAHDLRSPLSTILGFTELLFDDGRSPAPSGSSGSGCTTPLAP